MSTIKATVDGQEYSPVESISTGGKTVDLEAELDLEAKEITIEENGTTIVTPATGKDGMERVTVHTNVSGGGVNPLLYAANNCQKLFYQQTLPNSFAVEFGENVSALGASGGTGACFQLTNPQSSADDSELAVKCNGTVNNLAYTFYGSKFKKITLNFDTSHVTSWGHAFEETTALQEIDGLIDMSSATDASSCFNNMHATSILFKPNTIPVSLSFRFSSYMTKATVISLANGLDETVTDKKLTFFASSYATKLATVGMVSMDESNTYHIFTEDASGDTTLQNFITTIKGWTIE